MLGKLFAFEMKKIWRQRKLIWLLLIVILCTSVMLVHNQVNHSTKDERAREVLDIYNDEADQLYAVLNNLQATGQAEEEQLEQVKSLEKIRSAFFNWGNAISTEKWHEIPEYESTFLSSIERFESSGGHFESLQGIEREQVSQKNTWLRKHNLPYEDDKYPMTPALVLKQILSFLFGFFGIAMLLLFFGSSMTSEKEQSTWSTLRTQPLAKWKLVVAKYMSVLTTTAIFIILTVVIGLITPLLINGREALLQYPQIVTSHNDFVIISTAHYIIRASLLFFAISSFLFSFTILISRIIKNTFSLFLVTNTLLLIGLIVTQTFEKLQVVWNPLKYLQLLTISVDMPGTTDVIYVLNIILCCLLFIGIAILIPEHERNLFETAIRQHIYKKRETKHYKRHIMNVITFEWRKMIREKYVIKSFGLLILLMILGYFVISQQVKEKEVGYLNEMQESIDSEDDFLAFWDEQLAEMPKDLDEFSQEISMTGIKDTKKDIQEHTITLRSILDSYRNENWVPLYKYQLDINELANNEKDYGDDQNSLKHKVGQMTLDASIAEKEWLMERNIKPIFSGEFVSTLYHNWEDPLAEKEWEEAQRKVDHSGLYIIYLYVKNFFYFIPMILFFFILGQGFAGERGKNPTLNLMKTQPLREGTLFFGKFLYSKTVVLISWLSVFACVVLLSSVLNRFGDWNYPILHYDSPSAANMPGYAGNIPAGFRSGFHFINLGDYLVKGLILVVLMTLFIVVLAHFISLFMSHVFNVFVTTVLLGVIGYGVSKQFLTDYAHLSPFTYFDVPKILNGEISMLMNNPNVTVLTGCFIYLVVIAFVLILSYFILWLKHIKRPRKYRTL